MLLEGSCPRLFDVLGKPAEMIFNMWYALGLPPRGEAGLAGPFFTFFLLWIALGAVIGALVGHIRHKNDR
jgi:hypothetical protein